MPAADAPARRRRRSGPSIAPATFAVVLALLLAALGAVALGRTYAPVSAAPAPAGAAAGPAAGAAPAVDGPAPAHLPPAPPQQGALQLIVPALGIDRDTLPLGTADDGTLQVPATAQDIGWYGGGPLPGDDGPAVLAGHVDLDGRPGVFSALSTMAPGQHISVLRPDGEAVRFVVTRVEQHAKNAFPTDAVYGPTDAPELRLITCGGSFDERRGSYRDNVVVFAVLG